MLAGGKMHLFQVRPHTRLPSYIKQLGPPGALEW